MAEAARGAARALILILILVLVLIRILVLVLVLTLNLTPTPTPNQVRRVWAVSDIHVEHKDNWAWLSCIVPQPDDALVVAGDV